VWPLTRPPVSIVPVLISFVVAYLAVTILIGLLAARRVHNARDYMVAGRSLPLYMNVATVFATWFGAETVLSVSATFAKDGLAASRATRSAPACAW
jgi:SSS family solute:Na+ symporter